MEQRIRRALVSVYDKTGLLPFCEGLKDLGIEVISTGGTAAFLRQHDIPVTMVEALTGFPEVLDGRVKTLHPVIHASILADLQNPFHADQLKQLGIQPTGLVVVNLYPFAETIESAPEDLRHAIEMIDIGGPSMLRAAAKNHQSVAVISSPSDYQRVLEHMKMHDARISAELRFELAGRVFDLTASYDATVARYLAGRMERKSPVDQTAGSDELPPLLRFSIHQTLKLRYGENPHQLAAFYQYDSGNPERMMGARQLSGKDVSFNNLLDLAAAYNLVSQFSEPCAVVVKHQNPCGAAVSGSLEAAYAAALACDPVSAYGGIAALNRPVDEKTAARLHETDFLEVIAAPEFPDGVLDLFKKKKNRRIMQVDEQTFKSMKLDIRLLPGGALVQQRDPVSEDESGFKVVTERKPTDKEWIDLLFAWKVCAFVKSNAIVLARNQATVGIGAGQVSRVDASTIAAWKAGEKSKGAVLASDAFFPFRDGIDAASHAGVTAVIQPGGSIRDNEVIEACDAHGMAMVFTGCRHFRH